MRRNLPNDATTQSGELTTKGVEFEASHTLPGQFQLLVNYGYNKLKSEVNSSLDFMPRHTASAWATKTFGETDAPQLKLGAGVVYSGKSSPPDTSIPMASIRASRTTPSTPSSPLPAPRWMRWRR